MRRVLYSGGAVALLAAGAAAVIGFGGSGAESTSQQRPAGTAKITRATLTETEDVDGAIGYGSPTTVTGRVPGMVTGLPALGGTVNRGEPLYWVDATPVVLFFGAAPLHRQLAPGVEGADVKLLEENLWALGYRGFTVDSTYSSSTADVVEDWQSHLGLPETGTVPVGRVLVAPGPVRVAQLKTQLGDNATGPILDHTGSTRQVTVKLDVTKQDLATVGDPATVRLPNGTRLPGSITKVGSVATAVTANNQTTVTIDVTVSVADQAKLGAYDEAPVDVTLVAEERKDVLTVPVAALLALAEGGYGIQVIDGSTTSIIAVQTGLFAGGRVEVSGPGVTEGRTVGMPS